jgi:hypothetical protein
MENSSALANNGCIYAKLLGLRTGSATFQSKKGSPFLVHLMQPRRGEKSITEGAILDDGKAP